MSPSQQRIATIFVVGFIGIAALVVGQVFISIIVGFILVAIGWVPSSITIMGWETDVASVFSLLVAFVISVLLYKNVSTRLNRDLKKIQSPD